MELEDAAFLAAGLAGGFSVSSLSVGSLIMFARGQLASLARMILLGAVRAHTGKDGLTNAIST